MSLTVFFSLYLSASMFKLAELLPTASEDLDFCRSQPNFSKEQMEFCYQKTDLVKVLIRGYSMGHRLCQKAFNGDDIGIRWNCTNIEAPNKSNVFFSVAHPKEGSKEHAIMIAYTSAGMLYQLIKACEKNKLRSCQYKDLYHCRSNTCYTLDPLVPLRLIRTFFSSSVAARTIYQKLLNQHNREIGWEKITHLINIHGGKEYLSPFNGVMNGLQHMYTKQSKRVKRKFFNKQKIPIKLLSLRTKLVYTLRDGRFSYCNHNENWFWNGIGRRECQLETRDYFSLKNCVNMCCDYGYVNIPDLTTVCVGDSRKECQIQTINRYYCKYSHETVRKYKEIPWQDFR